MADDFEDPKAPHGRDGDGVPLAPYGLKADGTPRLSNRGRKPGATAPAPKKKAEKNESAKAAPGTPAAQKAALIDLADTILTPVALAATNPAIERKMGQEKACAVAGSVVIVQAYLDPLSDAVVQLAADKPGMLGWLERADDVMPYMALLRVGGQMAKALYSNFRHPDKRLAKAAAKYGHMRALQLAQQIEEQAAEFGLTDDAIEEIRGEQLAAARGTERHDPSEANGWTEFGAAEPDWAEAAA